MSEETGRKHIDPNVKGDMAEHYAITFLWDQGYHVGLETVAAQAQ